MKIKIIDLFHKIANGEEVPAKIKWRDKIWNYVESDQDYQNFWNNRPRWFMSNLNDIRTKDFITDEVEIIEEDKEIKELELEERENENMLKTDKGYFTMRRIDVLIIDKINELVKEMNKIKENKNE